MRRTLSKQKSNQCSRAMSVVRKQRPLSKYMRYRELYIEKMNHHSQRLFLSFTPPMANYWYRWHSTIFPIVVEPWPLGTYIVIRTAILTHEVRFIDTVLTLHTNSIVHVRYRTNCKQHRGKVVKGTKKGNRTHLRSSRKIMLTLSHCNNHYPSFYATKPRNHDALVCDILVCVQTVLSR